MQTRLEVLEEVRRLLMDGSIDIRDVKDERRRKAYSNLGEALFEARKAEWEHDERRGR